MTRTSTLIGPYGGKLVDLTVPAETCDEFKAYASHLPSLQISPRSVCDLELLATGAFSPLDRFMGKSDCQRVVNEMRLADGHIFPIPITLGVDHSPALHLDQDIALRNNENELLGIMTVEEIYERDQPGVIAKELGITDWDGAVGGGLYQGGLLHISGRLQVWQLPRHYDFQDLRLTPTYTRSKLAKMGSTNVVAFQTHTPVQSRNEAFIKEVLQDLEGTLLLQPVVGMTKLGDMDHYTRVSLYKAFAQRFYEPGQTLLSLLPLATHMGGPRDVLWRSLICRNYGANHLIVDDDKEGLNTMPLSIPHEPLEFVEKYGQELGVKIVSFQGLISCPDQERFEEGFGENARSPTNTISPPQECNEYLDNGKALPSSDSGQEDPLRCRQGVCIWFTGLSGSGKSTTAELLTWDLMERGRQVTVLDGDVIRTNLSKGLGFTKEERDTNVRRIGFVASELVNLGGVVICAVVSPYRAARNDVRDMVGADQFVEVFVDTPLEVCAARDVKGFYAKARRGELKGFTGIDDPYEPPLNPEIKLNTVESTPEESVNRIVNYLIKRGFLSIS